MAYKVTSSKSKQSENVRRINQLAMPNIHYVLSVLKEHKKSLDKNMRGRLEEIVDTIKKNRKIDLENLETALAYCKEFGAGDMNIKQHDRYINQTKSPTKFKYRMEIDKDRKENAVRQPLQCIQPPMDAAFIHNNIFSKEEPHNNKSSQKFELKVTKETSTDCCSIRQRENCDFFKSLFDTNKRGNSQPCCDFKEVLSGEITKQSPNSKSDSEMDDLEVIYNVGSSLDSRNTPDSIITLDYAVSSEDDDKLRATKNKKLPKNSIITLDYAVSSEDDNKLRATKNKKLPKTITALLVKYYFILLGDMDRNLKLYKLFSSHILKPILEDELSCLRAAYDCWKQYLNYADATVRVLQPYMVERIVLYPSNLNKELTHGIIGGQMPLALVQALKNMRQWRAALEDTLLCVMGLTIRQLQGNIRRGNTAPQLSKKVVELTIREIANIHSEAWAKQIKKHTKIESDDTNDSD